MSTEKYLAIWDERLEDFRWYVQPKPSEPLKDVPGETKTVYRKTGRFVTRNDGMRAEIYEHFNETNQGNANAQAD